jgi:pimeloyl-ACP methyl ester carboxylesterase
VAAIVDSIGEPVNVLGHSFGALCAFEAALLTPKIRALILYEGVPLRGADGYAPGTIERLEAELEAGDVDGMLVSMLRDVGGMNAEEIEVLRSQPEAWRIRMGNAPTLPRELRAEQQYVFDPRRFGGMQTRTLLLVGEKSLPREMVNAEAVARSLAQASVRVLPGEQHIAMHTAPEQFVDVVSDFIAPWAD